MKFSLGLLLFMTVAAFGQVQSGVVSGSATRNAAGQFSGSMRVSPMRFAPMPVQGAPYSGEEIQEQRQTLSDGTHINRTNMRRMMYRDSQGWTRAERPMMVASNGGQAPQIVEITDPVQGMQYTLDTEHKIAHRVTLQPFPGRTSLSPQTAPAGAIAAPPPQPPGVLGGVGGGVGTVAPGLTAGRMKPPRLSKTEKLDPQVFDGILAEGQRQTMTIPAGSQGNDRDINVVTEMWTSPDLHMIIYRKSSDPRSGDSIMHFNNLSRNEPDPQLFLVPPDYQVVDETGPFTIHYEQSDAFARGAVAKQPPVLPSGAKSDTPADSSPLSDGNGVSPPILIHKQEPEYTESARAAGIQGTVLLEFEVRSDGMPDSIRVIRPLDPGLDPKAIECLRNFRFRPSQKQGQPVTVKATIENQLSSVKSGTNTLQYLVRREGNRIKGADVHHHRH